MRQSGRVRFGGRGGGRRGRRPQRSPLASRFRSPGTRNARAPRRSCATSRLMLRNRTRSCSLGATRVAACGSSAWIYGGSWSRSPPPACRSAPTSHPPPSLGPIFAAPTARGFSLKGWGKIPLWEPSFAASQGFPGQQRWRAVELTQLGVWLGTRLRGASEISRTGLETSLF